MSPFAPWSMLVTAVAFVVALALTWQLRRIGSQQAALARPASRLQAVVWLWLAAALAASLVGFFQDAARFSPADSAGFLLFSTLMWTSDIRPASSAPDRSLPSRMHRFQS